MPLNQEVAAASTKDAPLHEERKRDLESVGRIIIFAVQ
jgi:hypothetical protein